jgi:ATP-binding cassette subfamily F protein uup
MALISMRDVSVGYGGPLLLDHVSLQIESGERICLLGRNGVGKSTLMRLLQGDLAPDAGEIIRRQGIQTALLPQEVPQALQGSTFDIIAGGLDDANGGGPLSDSSDEAEWRRHKQVEKTISRMHLDPDAPFEALSAGLKRRVMLARGIVRDPDILLLDEPTNHLDIESIGWMEDFLLRYGGTLLFVTHDRMFLRKLATRIVELDRGSLADWACGYDAFQERKQAALEAEAEQWHQFDKKLAREETWIRQGIKARRTRNEGRVRELEKLREARRARRERTGSVRMRAQDVSRSGKLIIEAEGVSFAYNAETPVIRDFSTLIMRGDKVGIIGPNGSGKTTLLRLLLGDMEPRKGVLRHGVHLEIAYFDQLRAQLDEDKSVVENVGEGNDVITFNGKPRHVIGYLEDFLFSPERARSPVRILSGGERNRLLLARLFTKPSNVLVMDEPTNDLDAETLELLEEMLLDYSGTLLLVSHDRTFLNNVVTSTLVFEGEGRIGEYVGGYDDWLRQRKPDVPAGAEKEKAPVRQEKQRPRQESRQKLSFKEQRELEALPRKIEVLEAEQKDLYRIMSDPSFYQQEGPEIVKVKARLESVDQELEEAYQRWEALEALNG